nr:hypothetical protein CFP56_04059 [Quercus suber]
MTVLVRSTRDSLVAQAPFHGPRPARLSCLGPTQLSTFGPTWHGLIHRCDGPPICHLAAGLLVALSSSVVVFILPAPATIMIVHSHSGLQHDCSLSLVRFRGESDSISSGSFIVAFLAIASCPHHHQQQVFLLSHQLASVYVVDCSQSTRTSPLLHPHTTKGRAQQSFEPTNIVSTLLDDKVAAIPSAYGPSGPSTS